MAIKFSKNKREYRGDVRTARIGRQRKDKYNDTREFAKQLLGGKCSVCGTEQELWFEYKGTKKVIQPQRLSGLLSCSVNRMMKEVMDYRLLCKKHWWENRRKNMGVKKHGTVSMYTTKSSRCRCTKCRAAWNSYQHKWQTRQRKRKLAAIDLLKKKAFQKLFL